jgi:hypothetical protein
MLLSQLNKIEEFQPARCIRVELLSNLAATAAEGNEMLVTSYADFKSQQLIDATTRKVFGRPLDLTNDGVAKRVALTPCLCTWDSPDSPCPCLHSKIWWILQSDIVNSGVSNKKTHSGDLLNFYDIKANSQVAVETIESISVEALTGKRGTQSKRLAMLLPLIKMIKAKKANSGSSKGGGGGPQKPLVEAEKINLWDLLVELAELLEKIFGSVENSGGDVEVIIEAVEAVGLGLLFL